MSTPPQSEQERFKASRQVLAASFIGTTFEWYDFFIYASAAALVFGPLFFPHVSEFAGQLAAFSTFAVGFVARPLGGIVIGHFGDRVGRKSMLVLCLFSMGLATIGIGLLPTYEQIGIWAPILLVLLRVFQGIGVGGERGGAVAVRRSAALALEARHRRRDDRSAVRTRDLAHRSERGGIAVRGPMIADLGFTRRTSAPMHS